MKTNKKRARLNTYEVHEYRTEEREIFYFVKAKTRREALAMVKAGEVDEETEDVINTDVDARWIANVERGI